jgi:bifunctional DNase/RNase
LGEKELIRSNDVSVFVGLAQQGSTSYIVTGIELLLEDGRTLTLVNIPVDVANAIKALKGDIEFPRRKSIFDLLANYEAFKEELSRTLKRVIIDELDMTTGLYTATVEFEDEGMTSRVKMIPSHAIFLALLTGAPIYVSKELVDLEDSFEKGEEG